MNYLHSLVSCQDLEVAKGVAVEIGSQLLYLNYEGNIRSHNNQTRMTDHAFKFL